MSHHMVMLHVSGHFALLLILHGISSYFQVRKTTANSLFESMMTNDDIVDEEKAEQIMSMLTETEWYVVGMNCLLLTKLKVKEIIYYASRDALHSSGKLMHSEVSIICAACGKGVQ